jgi:hypothetical protein
MCETIHTAELMFPINDEPSARLMLLKALYLLQAGSIDTERLRQCFARPVRSSTGPILLRQATRRADARPLRQKDSRSFLTDLPVRM